MAWRRPQGDDTLTGIIRPEGRFLMIMVIGQYREIFAVQVSEEAR
jgi:hypothetical protein